MLLALDTSSASVAVALHDGQHVVASTAQVDPLRHGELVAPSIAHVLEEADVRVQQLSQIAVGVGPGPFTGLRVGIATARTLAWSLGIACVGICSLDVIAAEAAAQAPGQFRVATDARRKEVYVATYAADGHRVGGPDVLRPVDVGSELPVVGRGASLYPDDLSSFTDIDYPSADVLATLVVDSAVELYDTEPWYLRRPDAVETSARRTR